MNIIENLFKENNTCLLNILEYVNYSTISIRKMTNHRIKRRCQQYRFLMPSKFSIVMPLMITHRSQFHFQLHQLHILPTSKSESYICLMTIELQVLLVAVQKA